MLPADNNKAATNDDVWIDNDKPAWRRPIKDQFYHDKKLMTEEEFAAHLVYLKKQAKVQCWYSNNDGEKGKLLLVLVPNALHLLIKDGNSYLKHFTAAVDCLIAIAPPKMPSRKDCCHPQGELNMLKDEHKGKLGIYHFFMLVPTGQYNPKNDNYGVVTSLDCHGSTKGDVVVSFFKSVTLM